MLLDAVLLTLIVSLVAGGRPGRLTEIELRGVWVFVLAAGARVALEVLGAKGSPLAPRLGPWLFVGVYLLLLIGCWLNRRLRPVEVIAVGVLLNFLVVAANGGSMPVDRELARHSAPEKLVQLLDSPAYTVHKPVTERTRLVFLADVLPLPIVPLPWPHQHPLRPAPYSPGSVGDIFVTAGACALLVTGLGAFGLGRRRAAPVELPTP